jgi:ketosteroid isomerase-like protein
MSSEQHDVESFVRDLNRAWVEERYEDLRGFFAEDVVLLTPGAGVTTVGAKGMVESYQQFGSMARVYGFEVTSVELHARGHIVMAHARFSVDYEISMGRYKEKGLEVYAVDVSGAAPSVVWRTQVISQDGSGAG